jgi:hypothetical protein
MQVNCFLFWLSGEMAWAHKSQLASPVAIWLIEESANFWRWNMALIDIPSRLKVKSRYEKSPTWGCR